MADTPYKAANTRIHWAGANADTDIHLEMYQNIVDTKFEYRSLFRGLVPSRSTADRSNTVRLDRLGAAAVKGRQSGTALDTQRVPNEKLLIVVDTTLYIRTAIDFQDDWTAPDFWREIGDSNGVAFAAQFDLAHITQLAKSRSWTAPASLTPNGAFFNGVSIPVSIPAALPDNAARTAAAQVLYAAMGDALDTLIKRKVPLSSLLFLTDVDMYSLLQYLPDVKSAEFNDVDGGKFAERRVTRLHGIPVVECTEFPTGAITASPLGANFNMTAADASCKVILFSTDLSIVTVEAKGYTINGWDDNENFNHVLDHYAMYTVGQRRPDTVCPLVVTRT